MPIPLYLAMTAGEFLQAEPLPEKMAWMACHFSCYGTGLSNLPEQLPEGSLIIVNDRMPPDRHDPQRILAQLLYLEETCKPAGFLLDFQRGGLALNRQLAQVLTEGLSLPVGVSELYAGELHCPVFLSQPPLHISLETASRPWHGREIWLETALQTQHYTLTAEGCTIGEGLEPFTAESAFTDDSLFCRYHYTVREKEVIFTLDRSKSQIEAMLQKAENIALAIGLYQQLGVGRSAKDMG